VIEYAFDTLAMREIRASTDAGNAASMRVLDKLGFTLTRRDAVGSLDTLFYVIGVADWKLGTEVWTLDA
jgi:RimJ/RimL family protein N-acetyltransferase